MFWQEDNEGEAQYQPPDDVVDLVFRLQGSYLALDHAFALAEALRQRLDRATCDNIGVLGVRMAESGNGWVRPEGESMPLSRRARLVIRAGSDDIGELAKICNRELYLGEQPIMVGDYSIRKLSTLGTLFSRAISCDESQSEDDFLQRVAAELRQKDIGVSKMICGKSRQIAAGTEKLFTRSLLVAGLKPGESVALQRDGIGKDQFLGCGLFVAHKAIDAVYDIQK